MEVELKKNRSNSLYKNPKNVERQISALSEVKLVMKVAVKKKKNLSTPYLLSVRPEQLVYLLRLHN